MAYTLACKDAGTDCPYVARGETEETSRRCKARKGNAWLHDEQINDPKFLEESRKLIKKT